MKKTKRFFVAVLVLLISNSTVFAGDWLSRFMSNDQDGLVIGEVTEINDGLCTVKVTDNLVTEKYPVKSKVKIPELIKVDMESFNTQFLFHNWIPEVGQYGLLSVDKTEGNLYKVKWGAYQVDSLDPEKLSIMLPDYIEGMEYEDPIRENAAVIKRFINSGCEDTGFFFDGSTDTYTAWLNREDGSKELIYKWEKVVKMPTEEISETAIQEKVQTVVAAMDTSESKVEANAFIAAVKLVLAVMAVGVIVGIIVLLLHRRSSEIKA